jgi:hypothetical protein
MHTPRSNRRIVFIFMEGGVTSVMAIFGAMLLGGVWRALSQSILKQPDA